MPEHPAADTPRTEAPPRSRIELLRTPVGALALGKMFTTLAVWTTNVAGAILVYELTGSALGVGLVSAAQFLPQLVLTPWSGARADRHDRLRQIVLGTSITALASVLLVVWAVTVGFTSARDANVMIAAAGLVGTGFALAGPATSALLPALVRRSELSDALSLSALPIVLARATGPALGATLYLSIGALGTFAAAGALHLGFLTMLAVLRRRLRIPARRPSQGDRRVRAGLLYVVSDRRARRLMGGIAVIGVGVDPITTLTPSLAAALGAPPAFVGTLASAFGVGAGLGFVVLTRVRLRFGVERLGSGGLATLAVGLLLAAVAPLGAVAATGTALAGIGLTFALNSFTTLVQAEVPDELRGRVMAVWAMAFLGLRPFSATLSGWITDLSDVRIAFALAATLLAIGAVATRRSAIAPARTTTQPAGTRPDVPTSTSASSERAEG
jgi:MFS family permease